MRWNAEVLRLPYSEHKLIYNFTWKCKVRFLLKHVVKCLKKIKADIFKGNLQDNEYKNMHLL